MQTAWRSQLLPPCRFLLKVFQQTSLLRRVNDIHATILAPAVLIVLTAHRTLLAIADHFHFAGSGAIGLQGAGHRIATALAEAEVVLTGTALVGIAFKTDMGHRAILQVLGMASHDLLELRLDFGLVEIEVDDTLAQARV